MTRRREAGEAVLDAYVALFLLYMFLPLGVMVIAAFNAYPDPSVTQWHGFTLHWFEALARDGRMLAGLRNSIFAALAVVALSLPIGLAAALLLTRLQSRARGFLYALMVSPILTPGIILGISTLVFWRNFGMAGGLLLAVLAQTSFIAAYCMLIFLARLQRFDATQVEAALDLGASQGLVFRRILVPFLAPSMATAAVVAFLQSFENYNTTVFSIGGDWTLVTEIGSRFRFGLTPAVNAIGVVFVVLTVAMAILHVHLGRRRRAHG
ncbi:ABC transporter permease [Chelatococcus sp. SYSU_G07232]|uniref:ABC transporter permease n=1 Tax=Chelatococcus albus TaxID=3047466 RepID=A0ABT7AK96_9HYPH|nr:ABC transporter permease [Chelatococcus sp. SYSU_G07232]MDJ1159249.1 ABC transporter permease [Chelatococcus sp. SYSU_G07232]